MDKEIHRVIVRDLDNDKKELRATLAQRDATIAAITAERDALTKDALRWRTFVGPQTALMLGSTLDPNSPADWKAECDRLADKAIVALRRA
jgi:hypothetical protein